ncbi:MAG: class I SAM-dependent methyltransferase [Candidatus Edwardsbacteria bacterium]|nr:class I SAM-dependent methyltransferase [Candidatus Edwardsbacteria bacterium]
MPMDHTDYTEANRRAWNEAQTKKPAGSFARALARLRAGEDLIHDDIVDALATIPLQGRAVAQFCCNNGEELLSLCRRGAAGCVGFDIADNFIDEATALARGLDLDCRFVRTDILGIEGYDERFDVLLVTIGALTWFRDLDPFFGTARRVLKRGGTMLIHETHPVVNMLAVPGEKEYRADDPARLANSYFKAEPWIETDGIFYLAGKTYPSQPLYSWSHPFTAIVGAMVRNGLTITGLTEYDHDIGSIGSGDLDGKGIPLSYLMTAVKA